MPEDGTLHLADEGGCLPASLRKIAVEELGETRERRRDAVEKLRRFLKDDAELYSRVDDEFLLRFIRVRKYDIEAALKTVKKYYRDRAAAVGINVKYVPSNVSPSARRLFMVLPQRDPSEPQVLFFRGGEWDPAAVSYGEVHLAGLLCLGRIARNPSSQTAGISLLIDYKGFTMSTLFACNLTTGRKGMEYLQDGFPVRIKAFHTVNESYALNAMYTFLRPFLKKKLVDRVHFYGQNFDALKKHIPEEILPEEYGGQAPPLDFDAFWKSMDDDEAIFAEDARFGYLDADATEIVTAL